MPSPFSFLPAIYLNPPSQDAERIVLAANDTSSPSGMATVALRPNGIFGPDEQHHTPKVLTAAFIGGSGSIMGPDALTDFTHRDNLVAAFLAAYRAVYAPSTSATAAGTEAEAGASSRKKSSSGAGAAPASAAPPSSAASPSSSRSRVGGRAFFVTDGWPCHTTEMFAPLLSGLGFPAPYRSALARLPTAALASASASASGKGSAPLLQYLRSTPATAGGHPASAGSAFDAAVACGAARVPPSVFAAALASGEAILLTHDTPIEGSRKVADAAPAAFLANRAAAAALDASASAPGGAGTGVAAGTSVEVLLTSDASFPARLSVPDAATTFGAALMQGAAAAARAATCGLVDKEPFLSLADSRKVLRHNYFTSAGADEALGYAPVTRPAAAVREVVAHYRRTGHSGVVPSPPLAVWLAVVLGLGLTAVLAYDTAGSLSAALATACGAAASAGLLQHSSAGPLLQLAGCSASSAAAAAVSSANVAWLLRVVLWAALLCHGLQGAWAGRFAWRHRLAAAQWAFQTAILGFASSVLLRRQAGRSTAMVPVICVSLFIACMPLVAAVDWASGWRVLA